MKLLSFLNNRKLNQRRLYCLACKLNIPQQGMGQFLLQINKFW